MNNRWDTRRSGTERQRYEADRGNARSDRERYDLSDRDESGYRGWGAQDRDEDAERWDVAEDREMGQNAQSASYGQYGQAGQTGRSDDRDRWRMMDESNRFGRRGEMDREQMAQGRGGYGMTSQNRGEFGRATGGSRGNIGRQGFRPSDDYRGQGYGGVRGVTAEEGGREDWSHRGYGGSLSSGYGQSGPSGMGGRFGEGRFAPSQYSQAQYGQGQYGQPQYGQGQYGQGQFGQGQYGQGRGQFEGQYGQGQAGQRTFAQAPEMQSEWGGQQRWNQGQLGSQGYGQGMGGSAMRRNKGVKGYKRSDDRIREDVCDQLGMVDDMDASDIEVNVSSGEVTLTGTVGDRSMKYLAEQVAERISGVNEIHNQLRVKRETGKQDTTNGGQQNASSNTTSPSTSQSTHPSATSNLENGRRQTR